MPERPDKDELDNEPRRSTGPVARPDQDRLDNAPRRPTAPKSPSGLVTALPVEEPGERTHDQLERDLKNQIEELEGTLRYMGSAHPQRQVTAQRLEQLKMMLTQMRGGT